MWLKQNIKDAHAKFASINKGENICEYQFPMGKVKADNITGRD